MKLREGESFVTRLCVCECTPWEKCERKRLRNRWKKGMMMMALPEFEVTVVFILVVELLLVT